MKFPLIILLVFTLCSKEINAQDFKPDWDNFTSEKYTIDFNSEVTTYYGTDTVGELQFKLASNSTKFVVLFVFKRNKTMEEFDTLFSGDGEDLTCVNVSNGILGTLYYKQFTYFVSPWQSCELANDKGFNDLHEKLFAFISKQY
jgi:hypothetical protein